MKRQLAGVAAAAPPPPPGACRRPRRRPRRLPPSSEASAASHPGAVKSPMVGTVYLSSEPGAPPFVTVGDTVKAGDTLLIIEAMKVMNPITAPTRRHRAADPRRERPAGRIRPAAVIVE